MKRTLFLLLFAVLLCGSAQAADGFASLPEAPEFDAISAMTEEIVQRVQEIVDAEGIEHTVTPADINFDAAYEVSKAASVFSVIDSADLHRHPEKYLSSWCVPVDLGSGTAVCTFSSTYSSDFWEWEISSVSIGSDFASWQTDMPLLRKSTTFPPMCPNALLPETDAFTSPVSYSCPKKANGWLCHSISRPITMSLFPITAAKVRYLWMTSKSCIETIFQSKKPMSQKSSYVVFWQACLRLPYAVDFSSCINAKKSGEAPDFFICESPLRPALRSARTDIQMH